ncbi:MAG: hypothetical protein ACPLKP_03665 [Microgenomates group bacterium]
MSRPTEQEKRYPENDPSGIKDLEKVLPIIEKSSLRTTKCCATGTCS